MKPYENSISRYFLVILMLIYPIVLMGSDVYGPKPFHQILDSELTDPWSPNPIDQVQNREHVLLLDAGTMSHCLTVDPADPSLLGVGDVSALTSGSGTYGNAMRSMFQILDLNTAVLATESLTGTYTLHPWLASYHALDADVETGSESADFVVIRDKNSLYMTEQSTIAFLVFTLSGSPSSTTVKATSRYFYDASSDSANYELDTEWSSDQWLKLDATSVTLTTDSSEATEFMLADANELIDVKVSIGSDFNPQSTTWQPNSFAAYPTNNNGEISAWDYYDSGLKTNQFYNNVDDDYQNQLGHSETASASASAVLDIIEQNLETSGLSMRYNKETYIAFRDGLLGNEFGALDMYNSVLDERTVEHVYFTSSYDDNGEYHPFMIIATHNAPSGPQFLIDVARPPGDNCCDGGYSEQNVTRNAVLEQKLIKIPLRDYGLVTNVTDNDLTEYGTLAIDQNIAESEWNVDNHTSTSSTGVAVDGVIIYPASNNVLIYASLAAEITSTGIHVGRGMGFHYHADGHSFNGNGINLYNISDYVGHSHPPIIGFVFDGIAIFGKHEIDYADMDGSSDELDEYGGHTHDDYGYHYHAFSDEVTQQNGPNSFTFQQNFLQRGAFKGLINDIPGFLNVNTNQFMDNDIKRYVGGSGTSQLSVVNSQNPALPSSYGLFQNFPNPFNPFTTLQYKLPQDSYVDLTIYDMLGNVVNNLVNANQSSGYKSLQWNATNNQGEAVSAGVYLYKIQAGDFADTKKMVLLK